MWGTRAQGVSLVGLVVGVTLATGMAMADGPQNPFAGKCNRTATEEDVEGAKGAHKAARQFYERGEYARAIQYWRDVFNLDCNAVGTLLNIANAYEKLGDRQNAIFALEAYLERAPDAPDAAKIQTRVKNLKDLQQSQAPTASASATTPPPPASSARPELPPPPPVKPFGIAPWITVGVGGAALIAGAILLPVGLGNVSGSHGGDGGCYEVLNNNPPQDVLDSQSPALYTQYLKAQTGTGKWWCPTKDKYDQAVLGQTQTLIGKIALGVGGAAVAGGLVWELLFNKPVPQDEQKASRVHVTPTVGPGMSGVLVHGSF
ncbi:tetratricopeptide repeat protein [Polyangium sp. 15x6]|uniref:tetratricopeptide repeat protein n=1 Tax=Polyangium sp. 15x6 TaxID=3042687 RepID=UPI00249A66A0|nr:tetratricopeptide repeat protein [Polyangium sp. 15x6]MDI3285558.1 tetratricopeptide repeat protein [Polyangium sp. 15x6]